MITNTWGPCVLPLNLIMSQFTLTSKITVKWILLSVKFGRFCVIKDKDNKWGYDINPLMVFL